MTGEEEVENLHIDLKFATLTKVWFQEIATPIPLRVIGILEGVGGVSKAKCMKPNFQRSGRLKTKNPFVGGISNEYFLEQHNNYVKKNASNGKFDLSFLK